MLTSGKCRSGGYSEDKDKTGKNMTQTMREAQSSAFQKRQRHHMVHEESFRDKVASFENVVLR